MEYDGEGDLSVERRPEKKVRGERGAHERVALSRWAEDNIDDPRSVVVAIGCGRAPPALPSAGRVFATEVQRDLLESMRSVASGEALKIRRLALTELPRLLASSSSSGGASREEDKVGVDGFDWTAEDLSVLRAVECPLVVAVLSGCVARLEASSLQKALVECLAVSDGGRKVTLWLSGGSSEEVMLGGYGCA
jgi:hypothetical protein